MTDESAEEAETVRVIGIDMTPLMLKKARDNAREMGLDNVELRLTIKEWATGRGVENYVVSATIEAVKPGG